MAERTARGPRVRRRPPVETTGVSRPEGGRPAAGPAAPPPVRQWPIVFVLTVVGVGLLVDALGAWRPGTVTIGVGLLLAGVLRGVLPSVGMLAVRSRFTDIVVTGLLGALIVVLTLSAYPHPLLHLPFHSEIHSLLHSDN